ncbi:hypothetical protein HSACCH_02330 [Halanaerobium saccharolyticum subsp. saccharolyticum DSM 6643]|uniref:Tetratricopeptide repeat protein n=1 Tax=Halanaerobium saccharolyticum subsp. saccharolyticum DSM 6643 TaxID=1293054 RepID=M5EH60_9FIRM|nr:tetratricopeptide repeat protein [Halanaerobium saccharolyticum]CCU80814.1 hypothetical protein HSACCH_02330 [Halanaerobium saccharolyticum subsp. saccharolyticum DSM 6643]
MDKNRGTKFHYQKALNLIKKNNVTEAIKELKLCLKFNPNDVLALNLLGLGYYLKCRFDKAEEQWKQSLSLKRKNNQAADYLELITKKDFLELRQQYRKILFNDSAAKSKKINFLKEIIKKHDELIEPYLILGLLYKEDQNYQEALKYLYQAYDLDSGNQNIKDYIMECENNEKASKFFNLAEIDLSRFNLDKFKISKYKKELIALITALLAVFLIFILSNGEPLEIMERSEIADNTTQSQRTDPGINNENNNQAANNNNNNSENESAANNFKKLDLNLNLMQYQAINNLVSLDLIRNIKNKEAEKNKAEVFEQYFDQDREQELFNHGLQRFRNQRYEEATIIFKQLYQLSDADYLKRESLFLLARSSQLEEDFEAAEEYYRLYINNYPNTNYYVEALYTLGLLLDERGKVAAAQQVLQELREKRPDSSYNNSKVYDILNKES